MGPKRSLEKLRVPGESGFASNREATSEGRLRLQEGSFPYEKPLSTPNIAPIESLLETMKRTAASAQSPSSGFEGRRSPATRPKDSSSASATNLPFPRVQAATISSTISQIKQESPRAPTRRPQMSISAAMHQTSLPKPKPQQQQPEPKNPFEEEEDETDKNNPFLEHSNEPAQQSKNPFEEDDYDDSLNPFAE